MKTDRAGMREYYSTAGTARCDTTAIRVTAPGATLASTFVPWTSCRSLRKDAEARPLKGPLVIRYRTIGMSAVGVVAVAWCVSLSASNDQTLVNSPSGRRLFERETFGGNGRTCSTCHSADTGT